MLVCRRPDGLKRMTPTCGRPLSLTLPRGGGRELRWMRTCYSDFNAECHFRRSAYHRLPRSSHQAAPFPQPLLYNVCSNSLDGLASFLIRFWY